MSPIEWESPMNVRCALLGAFSMAESLFRYVRLENHMMSPKLAWVIVCSSLMASLYFQHNMKRMFVLAKLQLPYVLTLYSSMSRLIEPVIAKTSTNERHSQNEKDKCRQTIENRLTISSSTSVSHISIPDNMIQTYCFTIV